MHISILLLKDIWVVFSLWLLKTMLWWMDQNFWVIGDCVKTVLRSGCTSLYSHHTWHTEESIKPLSWQYLVWSDLKIVAEVLTVEWYVTVVLICILWFLAHWLNSNYPKPFQPYHSLVLFSIPGFQPAYSPQATWACAHTAPCLCLPPVWLTSSLSGLPSDVVIWPFQPPHVSPQHDCWPPSRCTAIASWSSFISH